MSVCVYGESLKCFGVGEAFDEYFLLVGLVATVEDENASFQFSVKQHTYIGDIISYSLNKLIHLKSRMKAVRCWVLDK